MSAGDGVAARYGMVIDLDRCTGCGSCALACAVENNVPPAGPRATDRTGLTWMRVYTADNGKAFPDGRTVSIPIACQHCGHHPPCVAVCPQNAVDVNPETGVVSQVPERCLGCRYCMVACPFHARYFNWFDPAWPEGMERTLNPQVSVRMRGVVEKCNMCHSRWQAARTKAAATGKSGSGSPGYVPACVEACPAKAITFGDLGDATSEVARLARGDTAFRLLARLGTEPKVYYRSEREWVRRLGDSDVAGTEGEGNRG